MSATAFPFPFPTPDLRGLFERAAALPKVAEVARRVRKGATPHEVTYTENKLRVLRYTRDGQFNDGPPLVMAFALVNRPYILDLLPGKSVVEHFVNAGFDVFLIDWGCPSDSDRHLTATDYIEGYLLNVVNHVRALTGHDQISLLGYCMGGTMSSMFTALHPELIQNLILMTAPIDFTPSDNLLSCWTSPRALDVDAVIDTFGNAPPWLLQTSFMMLKPVSNLIEKYLGFYEKMNNEKFLEDYFAMETWINDNIPLAGETYREWVKNGYQRNLLVKGQWAIGGRKVNLGNITCPVLNLIATEDHLAPPPQSEGFNDLTRSDDALTIKFQSGHIGLAVSSRAQRELWPTVVEWLRQRTNTAAVARPAGGDEQAVAATRRRGKKAVRV